MRRMLGRALAIGRDPADDEDTRLRKLLLLVMALTLSALAGLWGLLYWLGGAPVPALIPWTYVGLSVLGLALFGVTRQYGWFAASQFIPYMTLPFVLMWSLGGPISGSGVALWAGLGPLFALLLGHRQLSTVLACAYAALMAATVLLGIPGDVSGASWSRQLLLALNLAGVPLVAWLLVRVFAGGHAGVLASVRAVIRRYLPAEVVAVLSADPQRLGLGGDVVEVTLLFADLGGYSTYAEGRAPSEVVSLLNRYFGAALPAILEEGGTPVQLPGDAIFAIFGAPTPRADHALRACRAAREILARTAHLADPPIRGPRFSIGVNSGPALVGNIGSDEYRNFTAIGDATNVAARLQSAAGPGEVVIGPLTATFAAGSLDLVPLGPISVKGRSNRVDAFRLAAGQSSESQA